MTGAVSRRNALAWAVPVLVAAVVAPAAAASGAVDLVCEVATAEASVRITGDRARLTVLPHARNSIDVTIKVRGHAEQHFNLVPAGTPTNGVAHMRNYSPGQVFVFDLPRVWRTGDEFQAQTIHEDNCVDVAVLA